MLLKQCPMYNNKTKKITNKKANYNSENNSNDNDTDDIVNNTTARTQ